MSHWEEDDTFLSRWLSGELSPEEKEAFEASPEGKDYMAMMGASELLHTKEYDARGELSKLKNRIAEAPKPKAKSIWMRPAFRAVIAASVILIITIAYLLSISDTTISTDYGQQEIVLLPDGSEVRLNVKSSISYNPKSWEENRQLKLVGEAFFEVKKGSNFTVETTGGSVKVLGTSFNVKSRGKTLDVICYTGKVNVSSANLTQDLTPGMTVRLEQGNLVRSEKLVLDQTPTWINGVTDLDDVPFVIALYELQNVFGLEVEYDNSLDTIRYDGGFPHDSAEGAIKLVLKPLNIAYDYDPSTRKLIVKGLNP
ncbi:MAG: FecR domain-containing protein [Bacteroidota bacterium]